MLLDAGKGNFAFHADAFGRRADDYRIPSYPYLFPPDPAPFVNGTQPNSVAPNQRARPWAAHTCSTAASSASRSPISPASIAFRASRRRRPAPASTLHQTKVTSKGEFRPQATAIDAIRFWLGASDYKHDELAFENGFDGVQQTFTNKSQEGRVEVQLAPFDLRFAALTTAIGVQASNVNLTAPGLRRRPVRSQPHHAWSRASSSTSSSSPTCSRCRSPAASSRPT